MLLYVPNVKPHATWVTKESTKPFNMQMLIIYLFTPHRQLRIYKAALSVTWLCRCTKTSILAIQSEDLANRLRQSVKAYHLPLRSLEALCAVKWVQPWRMSHLLPNISLCSWEINPLARPALSLASCMTSLTTHIRLPWVSTSWQRQCTSRIELFVLQCWDIAGQERLCNLIPSYIWDSSVAVIIYGRQPDSPSWTLPDGLKKYTPSTKCQNPVRCISSDQRCAISECTMPIVKEDRHFFIFFQKWKSNSPL